MRYSEFQSTIVARILACPELARFGEPIVLDPYADADSFRDKTAEAVRKHGVAIEIDWPFSGGDAATNSSGTTLGLVESSVYLNESPVVEHQPARAELVESLMGAIATPLRPGEKEIAVAYQESAKDDKGTIVHAIDCSITVKFAKRAAAQA